MLAICALGECGNRINIENVQFGRDLVACAMELAPVGDFTLDSTAKMRGILLSTITRTALAMRELYTLRQGVADTMMATTRGPQARDMTLEEGVEAIGVYNHCERVAESTTDAAKEAIHGFLVLTRSKCTTEADQAVVGSAADEIKAYLPVYEAGTLAIRAFLAQKKEL